MEALDKPKKYPNFTVSLIYQIVCRLITYKIHQIIEV